MKLLDGSLSLEALKTKVHALVECDQFGDALDAIRQFVEFVVKDSRSVAKVFASEKLDKLCCQVGESYAQSDGVSSSKLVKNNGTILLATELVKAGGQVEVAEGISSQERLRWLLHRLQALAPANLVLLTYNQDSVGIAAACSRIADKVFLIHHADHHLCLGVTFENFIHIDQHNLGFIHCGDELGIKNNRYWPLTVNCNSVVPMASPFLADGYLVTCSSGRPEKFDAKKYLYDYTELIPQLLSVTAGRHIHIGSLTANMLARLKLNFEKESVDFANFIHVPWVSSVAKSLIEFKIDLYISSFPLGGGNASIEAMAAGVPLLIHQSYRSRFNGGGDLVYPEALIWHTEVEFIDIVRNLEIDDLKRHSLLARSYYEKYYTDQALIESANFLKEQCIDSIPKIHEFAENDLQIFLDDVAEVNDR